MEREAPLFLLEQVDYKPNGLRSMVNKKKKTKKHRERERINVEKEVKIQNKIKQTMNKNQISKI